LMTVPTVDADVDVVVVVVVVVINEELVSIDLT